MLNKTIVILTLFVSLLSNAQEGSFTQADIDSISFGTVTKEKADKFIEMLQSDLSLNGWTKYYSYLSFHYLKQAQNDSAVFFANKAIETFETKEFDNRNSEEVLSKAYYIKGLREYFDNKKLSSLQSMYRALEIVEKYPNKRKDNWSFYIISRIVRIHLDLGDYELALKHSKKTLEIESHMSLSYEAGNAYSRIGQIKIYQKQWDSVRNYMQKALYAYTDSTKGKTSNSSEASLHLNRVAATNNIGDSFYYQNELDSATTYYKKAKQIFEEESLADKKKNTLIRYYSRANSGFVLFKENKIEEAIKLLENVEDSIVLMNKFYREEKDLKEKVYEFLATVYYYNKDYQKAIEALHNKDEYLNEYWQRDISDQLQLLNTEFEVKNKDQEISQLTKTTQDQETILKQRSTINWILLLFITVLIFSVWLYFKQVKIKNKYVSVNLEQRLLRSQLNPHFIFNSLTSASVLAADKSEKTVPYLSKFSSLLRIILKNSRSEFVTVSEELTALQDYMDLQSDFSKKFSFNIIVDENLDQRSVNIPPMFIQPFIENAILHGLKGDANDKIDLQIHLRPEKKLIHVSVLDNGQGYTKVFNSKKDSAGQSFSSDILKERLEIYAKRFKTDAKYTIKDVDAEMGGTQVDILIPYIIE